MVAGRIPVGARQMFSIRSWPAFLAALLVAVQGRAAEMPQVFTIGGELILIPTEPAHLFSPRTLFAIEAPDSVEATYSQDNPPRFGPNLPRPASVKIELFPNGTARRIVVDKRRLNAEAIRRLQSLLTDPNHYLGKKTLCSWDGEFIITFWKEGNRFPISVKNSFTVVNEEGGKFWWPIGSAGRLSFILNSIFPELEPFHPTPCGVSDGDRRLILDSELRALAEFPFR
jgi:hypothetical protein